MRDECLEFLTGLDVYQLADARASANLAGFFSPMSTSKWLSIKEYKQSSLECQWFQATLFYGRENAVLSLAVGNTPILS